MQVDAPEGVLNVVHGGKNQINTLLQDPDIRTVSFVGSVPVGQHIHKTVTDNMKRA